MLATGGFFTIRNLFSTAIAAYLALWAVVFIAVFRTFGISQAVALSLLFAVPFFIAVRLRLRQSPIREVEIVYLLLVLVLVLGGAAYTAWHWHDVGLDREHAQALKFAELTRLIRDNPAFGNVELFPEGKHGPEVRGTVASQTDYDRLKSLVKQYEFPFYDSDIKLVENPP
jgi:hypothetical protein